MRVLFLSLEKPHLQMFLRITKELKRIAREKVESRVIHSLKLGFERHGWMSPCKREIEFYKQMLEKARPDIIVVANDQGVNGTFIRLSRQLGIPSLAIQDGMLAEKTKKDTFDFLSWRNYLPWRISSRILDISIIARVFFGMGFQAPVPCWGTGGADKIATMGDYYKQLFVSRGVSPSKVIVTGYPLLDDVPSYRSRFRKEKILRKIRLEPAGPLILLITSAFVEDDLWSPSFRGLFVQCIINSVKNINGTLIIKVHPRENLRFYRTLSDACDEINLFVTKDFKLDELLLASDIVLTVLSTAGLWALAYGKPLVVMHCFFPSGRNLYEDMAVTVDNMHQLLRTLRLVLQKVKKKAPIESKAQNRLLDHIYRLDGKASERIAKLIVNMTERQKH